MSTPRTDRTDAELLRGFVAQHSPTAFGELTERHAGLVYRTCLRVLGNTHEAEDATQATFVVLAQRV